MCFRFRGLIAIRRTFPMEIMQMIVVVGIICWVDFCAAERQRQFFQERPSNVTVTQGDEAVLRCVVGNQAQMGNGTQWTKDGVYLLRNGTSFNAYPHFRLAGANAQGEYHLVISNASLEDDDQYECQVSPGPGEEKGLMAIARVNVLVPPRDVSLEGSRHGTRIEVKAETILEVTCRASGAKPAAQLRWYRNGLPVPEKYFENSQIPEDKKRFTTFSRLRYPTKAQHNGAAFTCEANHPAIQPSRPVRAQFTLSVIYPPGQPVITGYNAGTIVSSGDFVQLRCLVENGNPLPEVIWYRNSVSVGRNFTSTQEYTKNEYGFYAKAADNEAEFRCEASNLASISPLSSSIPIKVYFPPEKIAISGPDQAKFKDTVHFNCTSSASYPEAKLTWLVDGEPFYDHAQRSWHAAGDGRGTKSSSSISLKITHQRPEVTVTCTAVNDQLPMTQRETIARKTVRISYSPESAKITFIGTDKPLIAGERVSLMCLAVGGNPAPTIEWFKGERRVTSGTTSRYDKTKNSTISEFTFLLAPADNLEEVQCRAYNWASDGVRVSDTVVLRVHFPPDSLKIWPNPPEFRAGVVSELNCESASSNPSPTVEWFRNNEQLVSVVAHNKTGNYDGWVVKKKLSLSPTLQDNGALYECRVWSPVSTAVISEKVKLRVFYKPIFLVPISQTLEVLEGESFGLNATAYSNPPVDSYVWKKDQSSLRSIPARISVDGPLVYITRLQRNDGGVYTCKATNPIDSSMMKATVIVKYSAEIRRVTEPIYANPNETVSIVCEIVGNPLPAQAAKWRRFSSDEVNDDRFVSTFAAGSAVLTIHNVRREDTGNYTCVANNGIGKEDTRTTAIYVKHAPFLDHSSSHTKAAAPLTKTAELTCVADGVPDVKFTWHRDAHPNYGVNSNILSPLVYGSERISISFKKIGFIRYKSYLSIRNVRQQDYGTYRCIAVNDMGSRSVDVKFGPPEQPEQPSHLSVLKKTHDSVTLQWRAGFDGGVPQKFRVRYRAAGSVLRQVQESLAAIMTPATILTISGLRPKTLYTFSVQAVNDIGSSGFSNLTADTPGPASIIQQVVKEDFPLLIILLVALAGIILLVVNVALVVCFFRRHRRKKLQKRAASARLGSSPGCKVQMYSNDVGAFIGSDYQQNDKYGIDFAEQRPRSAMSEGNVSIRTVIEVDGGIIRSDYPINTESQHLQSGYLLDTVNDNYDDEAPTDSCYADALRTNTLQRELAKGVYNVPRATVRQVNAEDQCNNTYRAAQPVDDIVLPVEAGPLRDALNQEYNNYLYHQPAISVKQVDRRYSPTYAAQVQGNSRTPYAEVRPLLNSGCPINDVPPHASPIRKPINRANAGSPILTTFATLPLRTNLQEEMDDDDVDSISGDLV